MKCWNCSSENLSYSGVDDGYGDFGTELCDIWTCNDCEHENVVNCVDIDEDLDEGLIAEDFPEFESDDE